MDEAGTDAATRLIAQVDDTPNPSATAGRVEDLLRGSDGQVVRQVLADPSACAIFVAVVGGSGYLSSILRRDPAMIEALFIKDGRRLRKNRSVKEQELAELVRDILEPAAFDRILRRYKDEEYLRIGCRDLTAEADTREVMAELSDLAAASIETAVNFHFQRLRQKYGVPEATGADIGFVVLGMGKLSGSELNFSSDVDLVYLRGPEEGRTSGPETLTVAEFYEKLAGAVTRSLSEVTEDGFVFRVDLRLRPEGVRGELVPSVNNALDYYLGWGRTWERAALMKAVPVAGDLRLGLSFIEELEPFIYRKHLDYSTLDEMRAMKQRISAQLRRRPGTNIKLGEGGIREIEFFVQALQLINAGKIRRLRSPGTLEALGLLRDTGLVDAKTADELTEAYLFFRKTEHRIQINYQLQTHELPRTMEDQEELARRMGYRNDALASFLSDLDSHRRVVEDLFSGMFYHSGEEILEQVSPTTRHVIDSINDAKLTRSILSGLGFEDPASAYPILRDIVTPTEDKAGAGKRSRLLERLAPLFVEELLKVPEPGKALISLAAYIESLHASSAYFSTFLENPATVRFLMKILGESRFFTELLVRHPESIDSLIARGAQQGPKQKEFLKHELAERLAYCDDLEAELDALRRFKNEELLMIGVPHLSGEIESPQARRLVTELADVCLDAAVNLAVEEMGRKFGPVQDKESLPFLILGMGKLGGMEMTYLSDVDVIFIYDTPPTIIGRFSAHEWFARLANRIISILTVPTSEGAVFAIDTRLRPSGNKGPLVSSLESFRDYHRTTSQLWEKQALIKARPITGPQELSETVTGIVRDCIIRTELSDEDLGEIARLRRRMESEIALEDDLHVDMKTGHGGLVDVEFFVQANILKYARRRPEILQNNTLAGLAALRAAGFVDHESFELLDSGYRFLSNLEDRLRIMEYRSVNRMPLTGDKLKGLALRLGYGVGGEDLLLNDYFRITGSIRKIYTSFFGGRV
jgi:[glutamine synthetase] adenylyltransferase / [glutamine synthetase]-adenylyl-L-tyrosine phosphorylase